MVGLVEGGEVQRCPQQQQEHEEEEQQHNHRQLHASPSTAEKQHELQPQQQGLGQQERALGGQWGPQAQRRR